MIPLEELCEILYHPKIKSLCKPKLLLDTLWCINDCHFHALQPCCGVRHFSVTDIITCGTFAVIEDNASKVSDTELQDVVALGWDVDPAAVVFIVHFVQHGLVCALKIINKK